MNYLKVLVHVRGILLGNTNIRYSQINRKVFMRLDKLKIFSSHFELVWYHWHAQLGQRELFLL